MLWWIVDSINMAITLSPHRVALLKEIVSSIPCSQRKLAIYKWHHVLGELCSMALAPPGARRLFSQIQESLCHIKGKRVTLFTGIHEALSDFRWLPEEVANRPTCIYELVPLQPTVDGYHDASGYMCSGVVLPGPTAIPWTLPPQPSAPRPSPNPNGAHPVVWCMPFPKDIVDSLVSWKNPQGTDTTQNCNLINRRWCYNCKELHINIGTTI